MKRIRLGAGAEFDLIRAFLGPVDAAGPDAHVSVGPGDDCAVLSDGIALTVDMSVEGVHFLRAWLEPEEIGYRAAAAAMSDLAAVAAQPLGLLAALAAPGADTDTARRVMAGVGELAHSLSAVLLGGDFTRSPGPLIIDIVAVGRVTQPVLRSGAQPGDALWVTGTLGGAAAAVRAWRTGGTPDAAARSAFAKPRPRIAEAAWLASRGALNALIDLSDGLAGDAGHIAAASHVGIILDEAAVPIHESARAAGTVGALRLALAGGEDYELCLTAAAGRIEEIAGEFSDRFAVQLTRVGDVVEGDGILLRTADGQLRDVPFGGFDHLRGEGQ